MVQCKQNASIQKSNENEAFVYFKLNMNNEKSSIDIEANHFLKVQLQNLINAIRAVFSHFNFKTKKI